MNRNWRKAIAGLSALVLLCGAVPAASYSATAEEAESRVVTVQNDASETAILDQAPPVPEQYPEEADLPDAAAAEAGQADTDSLPDAAEDEDLLVGAKTVVEGDLTFKIIGSGAYVNKCDTSATVVEIPATVNEKPVLAIDASAFQGCSELTSVTIPESVTIINSNAFTSCSKLEEIVIPEGVNKIATEAFCQCTSLKKVQLPSTLQFLGTGVFSYCPSLETVTIPGSVRELSGSTFNYCTGLREVTFEEGVVVIGVSAFNN